MAEYVISYPGPPTRGVYGVADTITDSNGVDWYCSVAGRAGGTAVFVDSTGGAGSVSSVFGRSGVVVATSGDYSVEEVTGAAPLDSPALTGTPTAPTPAGADNSTKIATTAFVQGIAASGVESFNTRTGPVVPALGDYTVSEITGAAPLASPALTGTPTAPTQTAADDSTKIATSAFVQAALAIVGGDMSGTLAALSLSPTTNVQAVVRAAARQDVARRGGNIGAGTSPDASSSFPYGQVEVALGDSIGTDYAATSVGTGWYGHLSIWENRRLGLGDPHPVGLVSASNFSAAAGQPISNINGSGSAVAVACTNDLVAGAPVTLSGIPSASPYAVFNGTTQTVASADSTAFTFTSTVTGTAATSGYATGNSPFQGVGIQNAGTGAIKLSGTLGSSTGVDSLTDNNTFSRALIFYVPQTNSDGIGVSVLGAGGALLTTIDGTGIATGGNSNVAFYDTGPISGVATTALSLTRQTKVTGSGGVAPKILAVRYYGVGVAGTSGLHTESIAIGGTTTADWSQNMTDWTNYLSAISAQVRRVHIRLGGNDYLVAYSVPDAVLGTATGGSAYTLSSATAAFTPGIVGRPVTDTTTPTNVPSGTYITGYVNATTVTVNNALTAGTAQNLVFGQMSTATTSANLTTIIQAVRTACPLAEIVLYAEYLPGSMNLSINAATKYGYMPAGQYASARIPMYQAVAAANGCTFVDMFSRFGSVANPYIPDVGLTNSSPTVTSTSFAQFSQYDEGALFIGPNIPTGTTIESVQSATQATLSANATGGVPSAATATGASVGGFVLTVTVPNSFKAGDYAFLSGFNNSLGAELNDTVVHITSATSSQFTSSSIAGGTASTTGTVTPAYVMNHDVYGLTVDNNHMGDSTNSVQDGQRAQSLHIWEMLGYAQGEFPAAPVGVITLTAAEGYWTCPVTGLYRVTCVGGGGQGGGGASQAASTGATGGGGGGSGVAATVVMTLTAGTAYIYSAGLGGTGAGAGGASGGAHAGNAGAAGSSSEFTGEYTLFGAGGGGGAGGSSSGTTNISGGVPGAANFTNALAGPPPGYGGLANVVTYLVAIAGGAPLGYASGAGGGGGNADTSNKGGTAGGSGTAAGGGAGGTNGGQSTGAGQNGTATAYQFGAGGGGGGGGTNSLAGGNGAPGSPGIIYIEKVG